MISLIKTVGATILIVLCVNALIGHAQENRDNHESQGSPSDQSNRSVTTKIPITADLRENGVFLNEKRLVPARAEWNREIVVAVNSRVAVAIASSDAKGLIVIKTEAHEAMLAKRFEDVDKQRDVIVVADSREPQLRRVFTVSPGSYTIMVENRSNEAREMYLRCYQQNQAVGVHNSSGMSPASAESDSETSGTRPVSKIQFGTLEFLLPKRFTAVEFSRPQGMPIEIDISIWRDLYSNNQPGSIVVGSSHPDNDVGHDLDRKLRNSLAGATDQMGLEISIQGAPKTLFDSPAPMARIDFGGRTTTGERSDGAMFGTVRDGKLYTFLLIVYQGDVEKTRSEIAACLLRLAKN